MPQHLRLRLRPLQLLLAAPPQHYLRRHWPLPQPLQGARLAALAHALAVPSVTPEWLHAALSKAESYEAFAVDLERLEPAYGQGGAEPVAATITDLRCFFARPAVGTQVDCDHTPAQKTGSQ